MNEFMLFQRDVAAAVQRMARHPLDGVGGTKLNGARVIGFLYALAQSVASAVGLSPEELDTIRGAATDVANGAIDSVLKKEMS